MTTHTNKVLFKEEQRYKKPRIKYIMTAVVVILLLDVTFMVRQLLSSNPDSAAGGNEKTALLIATLVLIAVTAGFVVIFSRLKMITTVTEGGIQVLYPPILRKGKFIAGGDIERFEVRQYNPLIEFGGWGIKTRGRPLRRRRFGIALTAYGRSGLQLYLRDGKKLLIGTQRPEPFRHAVDKMLSGRNDDKNGPMNAEHIQHG